MDVGGQRHVPAALPLEKRPGIHCTGWMGPSACSDGCGKSHTYCDSIPKPSNP